MIVFHRLAGITLLSFCNRYDKPKCNIVHYLHNLVVNLVLILVNPLLLYLFNSVQLCSFGSRQPQNEESAIEIQNLNYENRIGNGIQNQTGLFLKGKEH